MDSKETAALRAAIIQLRESMIQQTAVLRLLMERIGDAN